MGIVVLGGRGISGVDGLPAELAAHVKVELDASSFPGNKDQRAILGVNSLRTFFTIRETAEPPSPWIRGISTFYPSKNAMSGMRGTRHDREFVIENTEILPMIAQGARSVAREVGSVCWYIDIEGSDAEVVRQILIQRPPPLLLFESSLIDHWEILELKALGWSRGLGCLVDPEDACFIRSDLLSHDLDG